MASVTKSTVTYVRIDDARLAAVCENYFRWKDLNNYIKASGSRGINMPDAISEPIACYALGYAWNRGPIPGDASKPGSSMIIEIKATSSTDNDLTSFSPKSKFDKLVFISFDLTNDKVSIYELNISSYELSKIRVSSTETIADQQSQKRRPRLSIFKSIIFPNNVAPVASFDLRSRTLTKY